MKIKCGRTSFDKDGNMTREEWEEEVPETYFEDQLKAAAQIPAPTLILVPKWMADAIDSAAKNVGATPVIQHAPNDEADKC